MTPALDDDMKQWDQPSSAHKNKSTSESEKTPKNPPETAQESSHSDQPLVTEPPKSESNHTESSSDEPPVPGEEKLSSPTAQTPSVHVTHHDHKVEIPSQLLDEARNDPLAAFNKMMAVRDKEKGIDPSTYYAAPPMQLAPTAMPQYPPNLYYPPPPFYPQQSTDAYRQQVREPVINIKEKGQF